MKNVKNLESGDFMKVSPSILSMDFSKKEEEIKKLNQTDAEFIHLDVMDGHFVSNTTFDEQFIKTINCDKIYDTHLMIKEPLKQLHKYVPYTKYLTFHYEAEEREDILQYLKTRKDECLIGLSIKPGTDVTVLDEMLPYLDLVLIMSVEPGKGGQKFMDSALQKLAYLADKKKVFGYKYLIEVDGGINEQTAKLVKGVGCEVVVAGSYVFSSSDYQTAIDKIR